MKIREMAEQYDAYTGGDGIFREACDILVYDRRKQKAFIAGYHAALKWCAELVRGDEYLETKIKIAMEDQ